MENEKCLVCSNLFDVNAYVTKCHHMFHYNCINYWLNKNKTCPECNESLTLFEIHCVDILNTPSGIENEESMSTRTNTQNASGGYSINQGSEEEGRGVVLEAKDTRLFVDNSDRRVRDNESRQGPSRMPNLNIYNHTGNVIVCDTYEPKTANFFGFGKSSSSVPQLQNEPQKLPWYNPRKYLSFQSSDTNTDKNEGSTKQLECNNRDEIESLEAPNVASRKRPDNSKGSSNQLQNRNREEKASSGVSNVDNRKTPYTNTKTTYE